MAQIIFKILDAILANVQFTLVASAANIWKTEGGSPGSLQQIWSYFSTKNEENQTMGILHTVSRFKHCKQIYTWINMSRGSANFKHQNNIENTIYLRYFCIRHQFFSGSTTTR